MRANEAFTLIEILITAVIGAALITAAVVGFGSITNLAETARVNVALPSGAISDLYGSGAGFITIGANPNYYQGAQSRLLKDRLMGDIDEGTAVFCLGRDFRGSPSIRPTNLPVADGFDFRNTTSPRSFLNAFSGVLPGFVDDDLQDGALGYSNASIFILNTLTNPSTGTNLLTIVATYEIDFVLTEEPYKGTLASVRRFGSTNNTVPTDYYHALYRGEANGANGFRPLAAFFPRSEATNSDFAVATNYPFYFVWWPDPFASVLEGSAIPSVATVPGSYANMSNRTGLFLVLPAFPAL